MIDNDPEIFKKTLCAVCKKRVATRLCDFVIGYNGPSFDIEFPKYETCDLPLCERCSYQMMNYDFCPFHKSFLSAIQPTQEMRTASRMNSIKEFEKMIDESKGEDDEN